MACQRCQNGQTKLFVGFVKLNAVNKKLGKRDAGSWFRMPKSVFRILDFSMDENNHRIALCVFCKNRPVEGPCVSTLFGAADVCDDCLPKYSWQVRVALGRLSGDSGNLSDCG